jgi:concanavalin A-like lectin/glucanase superfamily protein/HYR domain-containing protein
MTKWIIHIVLLSLATYQSYSQGLIAHFTLDNHAMDVSSYSNDGSIIGGVTPSMDRFGNPCGAMRFNGTDGNIVVPHSKSLGSINEEFSLCFWFKIENRDINHHIRNLSVVCKGNVLEEKLCMPQYRFQLFQFSNQSTISINTEFTEYDDYFQNHLLPVNKWAFMAVTYDGYYVSVYLDNNLIWSFPYIGGFCKNKSPLYIGKDIPGSIEYYSGSFDDIMIYNRALPQNEIEDISRQQFTFANATSKFNCPGDITQFVGINDCYSMATLPPIDIADSCQNYTIKQVLGPKQGESIGVGKHQVAFLTNSASGQSQSCYYSIIVRDTIPPVIKCPNSISFVSSSDTSITYNQPVVSDNCGIRNTDLTAGIASNGIFPFGDTKNTFRTFDLSGNSASCTFNVFIEERKISNQLNQPDTISKLTVIAKDKIEDSIDIQYTNTIDNCFVIVQLYDDRQQDNDTISFFVNDKLIIDRQMIKNKRNGIIQFEIELEPNQPNKLVSKAWNVGKISPNTLTIVIYSSDGKGKKLTRKNKLLLSKRIYSKPGMAGAIILTCN